MIVESYTKLTSTGHKKRAIRMRCDVCGVIFERDVNVKKWSESVRHRCSIKCFAQDSMKGGKAWAQRRKSCLELYGVPSVVQIPEYLQRGCQKAQSEAAYKKRKETRAKNMLDTLYVKSRGMRLQRSKPEIECINMLSSSFGHIDIQKCVKHDNGFWFIDGYFPEVGLYVEFDGVYWHSTRDSQEKTTAQDTWFQAQGLPLLRITDTEWKTDKEACMNRCKILIDSLRQSTDRK